MFLEAHTVTGADVKLVLHHGTREDASPGLHVALAALQVCLSRLPQHAGAHGHEGIIGCQEALLLEALLRGM